MSKISQIYDQVLTVLQTTFPNKKELVNAFNLEDNHDLLQEDGYGITMDGSTVDVLGFYPLLSLERSMTIKLTKKYYDKKMSNTSSQTAQKDLLEDALLVTKALLASQDLKNITASFLFDSDDGIEQIFGDKKSFLSLSINFTFKYVEE